MAMQVEAGLGMSTKKSEMRGCRNKGYLWDFSRTGVGSRDLLLNFHLGLAAILKAKDWVTETRVKRRFLL